LYIRRRKKSTHETHTRNLRLFVSSRIAPATDTLHYIYTLYTDTLRSPRRSRVLRDAVPQVLENGRDVFFVLPAKQRRVEGEPRKRRQRGERFADGLFFNRVFRIFRLTTPRERVGVRAEDL